jgi:hypothetical protein
MTELARPRAFALAILAAIGAACGDPQAPPRGGANVAVTFGAAALRASSIERVTLVVEPGAGAPAFAPLSVELSDQGAPQAAWAVAVQGIPAGPGRRFHVAATDAAGLALYAGDAVADVAPGGSADVHIVLQGLDDGGFSGGVPTIDGLSSSASSATAGTPVDLSVSAHGADPAVALRYAWTASCGTFSDPAAAATTWTAPSQAPAGGACQISVTVSAGSQAVTASLPMDVL